MLSWQPSPGHVWPIGTVLFVLWDCIFCVAGPCANFAKLTGESLSLGRGPAYLFFDYEVGAGNSMHRLGIPIRLFLCLSVCLVGTCFPAGVSC